MSKKKPPAPSHRWWDPVWSWKVWVMVAAMLIPTLGFAFWVLSQAGGQTKIDPATLSNARRSSDSPITAITGTEHTVYHASNPLPEAKAPREDGKATLVWFTTTTCKDCEAFSWLHKAANELRGEFVFMEKDTTRDAGDERLGVKDVPAFVWLDAEGNEIGRPTSFADAEALKASFAEVTSK